MPLIIPRIVEQDARGEKGWDIISRLLKDRIIFIGEAIDEWVSQLIVAQLLYLLSQKEQHNRKKVSRIGIGNRVVLSLLFDGLCQILFGLLHELVCSPDSCGCDDL